MSKREYLILTEPERLKEFGFEFESGRYDDEIPDSEYFYYYFELSKGNNLFIDYCINKKEWIINLDDVTFLSDTKAVILILYDLITAGIVKKVEEE
jgi:hypothetical protein